MLLALTEDQELLAKTAADWVREHSPIARVRQLRDAADPVGWSRAHWKQMAELGWVGVPFPEEHGGAGMGFAELAVVLEALADTRAMLLGGAPLDGPRHLWWNFVASAPDRIERAKRDWREGRFALPPGETESIPLPER